MSSAQVGDDGLEATRLGRILLVDDQAQNRDMLGRRLERRGYQVILRDSAVGIEDTIAAENIELVLLDWMMPERSGHDALLGIRTRYDAEHVPVIVVTALDDGDVVSAALEAGSNDYITKPIDLRVLTARVKAQLDRRAAVLALDAIRNDLEVKVLERTQDLRSANETLSEQIAEREAAEARAQLLARHDPLTGLANRRHFLEELERRLTLVGEGDDGFALMFVDLDRFKPINDVHGHAVGDQLLQVIGTRLSSCIRSDSFAARLGGDEFAILLEGVSGREDVSTAAQRILNELAAPIQINGLRLTVGASIGVAICPDDGRTAADILQRGDAAMLRAKQERGAFTFFDSSIDEQLKSKASLEAELRSAIPAGDIVPYFQPLVKLATGEAAGFEVLARWPHRTRGMISPVEFIPVAEEAGLVDSMFWALLAQACRKALDQPGQFMLAVNISPSQVRDQWFPEKVLRTLKETGFPAQRLEIEVTESAMIGDMERAKASLMSLKNQGVRVALDDFGTGYSSLYLLRALPIDKLKIDRSFVSAMTTDRESATIVGALVGLGKALGLEVTAEGVEDVATVDALAAMGCHLGQGYLFGAAAVEPIYVAQKLRATA
ncbi:diguanylate cyclase/phosphodiesterase [alpha proteobacterium U9-1i]|nr:diguanylate cyclase/phosphodiesterase [alpha proteobacterium U9-1i]